MSTNKSNSKSFEDGSVHSDCSELQLFTNLSVTDFHSRSTNDSSEAVFQSDKIQADIVGIIEENCTPLRNCSSIRLSNKQSVVLVKCRSKPADHKKMGYRQIPNPWRRHGSLKTICSIGGWITPRGKDHRLQYVKPGSVAYVDPKAPHLSLHNDPLLSQKFFKFKILKNVDSQTMSNLVGRQIAENAILIYNSKQQTDKSISKVSRNTSSRRRR